MITFLDSSCWLSSCLTQEKTWQMETFKTNVQKLSFKLSFVYSSATFCMGWSWYPTTPGRYPTIITTRTPVTSIRTRSSTPFDSLKEKQAVRARISCPSSAWASLGSYTLPSATRPESPTTSTRSTRSSSNTLSSACSPSSYAQPGLDSSLDTTP